TGGLRRRGRGEEDQSEAGGGDRQGRGWARRSEPRRSEEAHAWDRLLQSHKSLSPKRGRSGDLGQEVVEVEVLKAAPLRRKAPYRQPQVPALGAGDEGPHVGDVGLEGPDRLPRPVGEVGVEGRDGAEDVVRPGGKAL